MKSLSPMSLALRFTLALVIYLALSAVLDVLAPPVTTDSGQMVGQSSLLHSLGIAFLTFLIPLWVSQRIEASRGQQFMLWFILLFAIHYTAVMEGIFFAPELVQQSLVVSLLRTAVDTAIIAALISWLFAQVGEKRDLLSQLQKLSLWGGLYRGVFASISYMVVYFAFGMVSYFLVVGPYYEAGIAGLTVPAPETILKLELVRAPIMVFSVIPMVMLLPESRKKVGAISGLLLAWLGGLVPLLDISNILPAPVIAAHTVEIFFQNFTLGMIVVYLFWKLAPQHQTSKA